MTRDPSDDIHDDGIHDDGIDDDITPPDDDAPRPSRGRLLLPLVLGMIAFAALVVAVVQTQERNELQAAADDRAGATDVASRFAERLLSYDHEALDAQVEDIEALATTEFADQYRDALDGGLGASIEELEASSTATVNEVLASDASAGRARVVVVVDSEISSQAGTRAAIDTYLDIQLLHLDGRWQVDDVTTIANQGDPALTAPDAEPDSTSTTTSPGG